MKLGPHLCIFGIFAYKNFLNNESSYCQLIFCQSTINHEAVRSPLHQREPFPANDHCQKPIQVLLSSSGSPCLLPGPGEGEEDEGVLGEEESVAGETTLDSLTLL